jgi:hypothetical protein
MSNCPCPCDEPKCEKTPVKIVIDELDVACIKIDAFTLTAGSDNVPGSTNAFTTQPNAIRLSSYAALKARHCVQLVCEPTVFYTGSASGLLSNMENFAVDAENGIFAQISPFSDVGQAEYFLNYISNNCHAPESICQHGCSGQQGALN